MTAVTKRKILLVEDNKKIMESNFEKFIREGYAVTCAFTLTDARSLMRDNLPDIILLDVMMPDGSGFEFAKEIRDDGKMTMPILFLTGSTSQSNVIQGLKIGDDYMTKPYYFDELLMRVASIIRRYDSFPNTVSKGLLTIDVMAGIAKYGGNDLLLSKKEFALLLIFAQNEEQFFKPEYLYEKVWSAPMGNDRTALKGTLKRLRAKIEGCGWSIGWSRGEGYIFEKS